MTIYNVELWNTREGELVDRQLIDEDNENELMNKVDRILQDYENEDIEVWFYQIDE